MSINYQAVGWNRQKKIYDGLLLSGIMLYLMVFVVLHFQFHPTAAIETVLIRAFGSAALILLHFILSIGPLCRIEKRFLPLLFNRRHMGVTMFLLALIHALLVVIQYHAFSDMNPLVSIFVSNDDYGSLANFPFQPLGFLALMILFLMAATSHDFWLANLTAPVWKALHMGVYVAYALLVAHVCLGILQTENHPANGILVGLGLAWVVGLHLWSGALERGADKALPEQDDWVQLCAPEDIHNNRARIFQIAGERIAVFKYDGMLSAVSNACQHQNGPLGEGKVIDGCITCPWHGYQYKPHDGASPEPFTEKVPTFNLKLKDGRVWVDPLPNPPGTPVTPVTLAE